VWSQDYVPIADFDTLKNYGQSARDIRLRLLRYRFDVWLTRRADYYIPFSDAVGDALLRECAVSAEKVRVINVGVDLELWPHVEPPPGDQSRPELLFVGGDFIRKGGDLLLDVVREHFADRVTLHLVTQQAPAQLPDYVRVHSGLGPNDPRLRELYGNCTALVLPTTADMAPQVVMEAMATGRPVISTRVGAIPEMVSDGQTGFLIEPNDGRALKTAIDRVLADRALARGMGQKGRAFVEEHFNAALSTSRILAAMKELTDRRRFRAARSKSQRTFASA
jgi:glycosyltransferase involved in cell wall biosynthesis